MATENEETGRVPLSNFCRQLDHGSGHYALHRFFAQPNGWHVNGGDPEDELWNATTATEMSKERVASHIQE